MTAPDEKPAMTREEVLEERRKFLSHTAWAAAQLRGDTTEFYRQARDEAARRFPMPERTVTAKGLTYRFHGGRFQHKIGDAGWSLSTDDPAIVRALASLLDDPEAT